MVKARRYERHVFCALLATGLEERFGRSAITQKDRIHLVLIRGRLLHQVYFATEAIHATIKVVVARKNETNGCFSFSIGSIDRALIRAERGN